jgi:hypothetical protein
VASSACAIGFLLVLLEARIDEAFLRLCAVVLLVQGLVGAVGFALHAAADLRQPGSTLFERILSGAPPMAPLLFPNLVALGIIGLWVLAPHVREHCEVVERSDGDSSE